MQHPCLDPHACKLEFEFSWVPSSTTLKFKQVCDLQVLVHLHTPRSGDKLFASNVEKCGTDCSSKLFDKLLSDDNDDAKDKNDDDEVKKFLTSTLKSSICSFFSFASSYICRSASSLIFVTQTHI